MSLPSGMRRDTTNRVVMLRKFYSDTATIGTTGLMCGYEFFGAEHMLFGTDTPLGATFGQTLDAVAEVEKMRENLSKLKVNKATEKVGLGSVVYTTQGNYFIAISAGVLKVENDAFFAISPVSPLAQVLLNKQVNDQIQFRDQSFRISKIR